MLAAAPASAAGIVFQGLGALGGSGTSTTLGMSADGRYVVGTSNSQPFVWTSASGMSELWSVPPGMPNQGYSNGQAWSVSNDGKVVVLAEDLYSYQWQAGVAQALPYYATAVSGNGAVVVGGGTGGGYSLSGGAVTTLPGFGAWGTARGVSFDGSVIAGYAYNGSATEAYRYAGGVTTGLGFLAGSSSSFAYGLSPDGSVVVGNSGAQAFRWTQADGMEALGGAAGATFVDALDVSNGDTIVGRGLIGAQQVALIWDPDNGTRLFSDALIAAGLDPNILSGWTLTEATAISDDGRVIAGSGYHNGVYEAWEFAVPEPATGALLGTGLLGLAAVARRRSRKRA